MKDDDGNVKIADSRCSSGGLIVPNIPISTQHGNTFYDISIVGPWSNAVIENDCIQECKNRILM